MRISLAWNAPASGPAVEFYTIWYSRKGWKPHKKIEQGSSTVLDLTDGAGLYQIDVTACFVDETCSKPVTLEWFCDERSDPLMIEIEQIRLLDGVPMLGFNAKPDCTYALQIPAGDDWQAVVMNVRGNGYTEIPAIGTRSRIVEVRDGS